MWKEFTAVATAIAVSGCSFLSGQNFKESEHSRFKQGPVFVALVSKQSTETSTETPEEKSVAAYLTNDAALNDEIQKNCLEGVRQPRPGKVPLVLPAVAVPIVLALGKLAFDSVVDTQIKAQEQLKKDAQSSYSGRLIISGKKLREYSCALIFRDVTDKSVSFVALTKLSSQSEKAFQIQPVYIKANNSLVVTEEGADKSPASINVSIAVSTKALGKQTSGVTSLALAGEGVISIPNIHIGPDVKPYNCDKNCPTSDLVAYPEGNDDPSSITFSVTETGKIGFDIDQSAAELKAIKEALGPALKESLKEVLK